MVDHAAAEAFLERMRQARIAGDVEAVLALFTDDVTFTVIGFGEGVRGKEAMRTALSGLVEQFEFVSWTPIATYVSGSDVIVRHNLTVRHVGTGKAAETQTSEFLSMRDGRCHAFTQYIDSGLVGVLAAA